MQKNKEQESHTEEEGEALCCVRRYSALPGLQYAQAVEYRLLYRDGGWWIGIRREGTPSSCCCVPLADGTTAAFARQLLTFLYENAVPPEHGGDILADLLH